MSTCLAHAGKKSRKGRGSKDMTSNQEQRMHDLASIVGMDHLSSDLFERINYADTLLPYDVEEKDLPYIVVHPGNTMFLEIILPDLDLQKRH